MDGAWIVSATLLLAATFDVGVAAPAVPTGGMVESRLAMPVPPGFRRIDVKPSRTDPKITAFDHEHRVVYDPRDEGADLLVFLVGTTEKPMAGPQAFFETALGQGYRVVVLAYISYPAVAQVCAKARVRNDPDCAMRFRQRRIYGDGTFEAIPDQPHDAIVPRLTKLLEYLARHDPGGHWGRYLDEGRPDWGRIAVSGQSQGGGMAQYLGKKEALARVLSFSGGWDHAAGGRIASWYAMPARTPMDRWFFAYHVEEPAAGDLRLVAEALALPADHVFALDGPLGGKARASRQPGHGSAINGRMYRPVWIRMLGDGGH